MLQTQQNPRPNSLGGSFHPYATKLCLVNAAGHQQAASYLTVEGCTLMLSWWDTSLSDSSGGGGGDDSPAAAAMLVMMGESESWAGVWDDDEQGD